MKRQGIAEVSCVCRIKINGVCVLCGRRTGE